MLGRRGVGACASGDGDEGSGIGPGLERSMGGMGREGLCLESRWVPSDGVAEDVQM